MKRGILKFIAGISALIFGLLGSGAAAQGAEKKPVTPPQLTLVLAKDHLEGNFTAHGSVYANRKYVFLASAQGRLFILDRKKADYPVIAEIQISSAPLTSVRGDRQNIYVSSADGSLYVYRNRPSFPLVTNVSFSDFGLNSVVVEKDLILVSKGQTAMATDSERVYLSELNPDATVLEVDKRTLTVRAEFGETFEPNVTVAYDRHTGDRLGAIGNPPDLLGRENQAVNLFVGNGMLMQATPGCCGTGVYIYDAASLDFLHYLYAPHANAVALLKDKIVVGTEAGWIEVYDLSPGYPVYIAGIDLRTVTGHTGPADIEIRSLWVDEKTGLIFAGSSWGDETRGPTLPSFFVLQLK